MKKNLNLTNFKIDESITLDDEEKEMLAGIKDSHSIMNDDLIERLSNIAKSQNKRSRQINMRLTENDYLLAKAKALEEGIPYQVLLASVIHKWLHAA